MKTEVLIFTDGACSGNPGPGGWAAIIAFEKSVVELGGRDISTTNNRMELQGILSSLNHMSHVPELKRADIYSDSLYCLRAITQWAPAWKRSGWKTKEGKDVANIDLFEEMLDLLAQLKKIKIHWHYCRGHQGIPGNERCDEIAVSFSLGQSVYLYSGDRSNYSVDLSQLPADEPWPENNFNKEKPKVHSYLSLVNGVLERHTSWPSCEAKVKGVPGAKFKKAFSAEEEMAIQKSWGLTPKKLS